MNKKRNNDGQTIDEFLSSYDSSMFKKPSLTVDNLIFTSIDGKRAILMIKRGNHPFIFDWAFPGGFVDADESCEDASKRELEEETGIKDIELTQLITVSTPLRDERCWCVSVCFIGELEGIRKIKGQDDAIDADFFTIDYTNQKEKYVLTLTSSDGKTVLRSKLNVVFTKQNTVDLNKTKVTEYGGIAFDHSKIILYEMLKNKVSCLKKA